MAQFYYNNKKSKHVCLSSVTHGHNPREPTLICLYEHEKWIDLHLRGDFRDCSHAVVLRQGVVVEHDPLRQPQLV